jgi:membrane-associated protease RseP (regulator of RpoE activity)
MAYGYLQPPSAPAPQSAEQARRVGQMVNAAGAVLSVALLAGVGFWSYRLMVRDVSGVPVVQALDGPMRVSPADPGGRQAAYQGLAVNSVAAQDGGSPGARQIALAPPPIDISQQDRLARSGVSAPAPVAAPTTDSEPAGDLAAATAAEDTPRDALDTVPLGTPGVSRSPLPPRRPGSVAQLALTAPAPVAPTGRGDVMAEAALQEIATRLSGPQITEIDPTSLTAGTRLVQLGAYETEDEARRAWADLAARFPGYLDGRGRVVEAATAGGRVFYRLRAHGFRDEPEARWFCSIFVAEEVDCTPVLIR